MAPPSHLCQGATQWHVQATATEPRDATRTSRGNATMTMTSTGTLQPGGAATQLPLLLGLDIDQSVVPYLPKCDFFDFFMRYSKNYSPEEHAAIKSAGKHVGIIWESGATNAFLGKNQGTLDAERLIQQFVPPGPLAGIVPSGKSAIFPTIDSGDATDENIQQALWYWYAFDEVL